MRPLLSKVRSRLVLRIYIAGLVQFAVVALGAFYLVRETRPTSPFPDMLRYVADTIAALGDDDAAIEREVKRVQDTMHWNFSLYDDEGNLVAGPPQAAVPAVQPPPSRPATPFSRRERPPREAKVHLQSGRTYRVVHQPPPMPPPSRGFSTTVILVLIVVGIFSWLTARSLAKPLARLASAAHDLGEGKLATRVGLRRTDELGEVSTAFDQMAERVTNALRAEKELLANVSHEFRTPLQRIRIALELAAEGDADTARESLKDITEDLSELERIVEDVLTAARLSLQEGKALPTTAPPIRVEPTDVRALLDRSESRFRAAHPARSLTLAISEQLPTISADPVLLRRVVDNLLDNAAKYTEDHAEVALRAHSSKDGVVIEVADRGAGIAPEDLERVFEPFFRADRSRTRATGGLGLGLALARRIVEAHGGTLSLESAVGAGTKACIQLPAAA